MESETAKLKEIIDRLTEENKELHEKLGHIVLYACQLRKELKEQRRPARKKIVIQSSL